MKKSELQQLIKEEISKTLNENVSNYMFFQNLKTIRDAVDEMLSLDPMMVDMVLSNGHDWANDHISTSKDDIEDVRDFLITKSVVTEKLKGGQKRIAAAAEPKDKITGADFKALRAMKKK
jgi:predicted DNA-binding protein